MPRLAELISHAAADELALARFQAQQAERQALDAARTTPAQPPVCGSCGQRLPVAPVVFQAPGN